MTQPSDNFAQFVKGLTAQQQAELRDSLRDIPVHTPTTSDSFYLASIAEGVTTLQDVKTALALLLGKLDDLQALGYRLQVPVKDGWIHLESPEEYLDDTQLDTFDLPAAPPIFFPSDAHFSQAGFVSLGSDTQRIIVVSTSTGEVVATDPTGLYPSMKVNASYSEFAQSLEVWNTLYQEVVDGTHSIASLYSALELIDPTALTGWWHHQLSVLRGQQ